VAKAKLGKDGGTPVRTGPMPSVGDISGRFFGEQELENLKQVIESGKVFRYGGRFVEQLEKDFAAMHGVRHAMASTSGTAAIHIAIAAVNPDPGDEIITSPITDIGSIAPILMQNAIPIFADLDPRTYTLDPKSVRERISERTRAILPVHLFGNSTDMDPLLQIAKERGLKIIEDCCQSYLAEDKGRLVGTIGDIGCFSMQQSKHMTTGDGGITITNDDELAERARLFSDKGWPRTGTVRDYLFLGLNYRMNELTGAVACAQLGRVREVVENRRRVAERISKRLAQVRGIQRPAVREGCKHSYWLYAITLQEGAFSASPAEFASALGAEGVPAGAGYIGRAIYLSPLLREKKTFGRSHHPFDCPAYGKPLEYREGDCPATEEILRRIITLPCNEKFTDKDADDIAEAVAKVADFYRC